MLRARGFHPIHHPVTRTLPPEDDEPLRRAAREITDYDWLIVTSARAVPPLVDALERAGTRRSGPRRCCAVGPGTADALRRAGIPVDLVPERYVAEGVVEALRAAAGPEGAGLSGARILLPRAQEGRDVIPRELRAAGGRVDVVAAYRTDADPAEAARLAEAVERGGVDILTFTAGSAVRSFSAAWHQRTGPRSDRRPDQRVGQPPGQRSRKGALPTGVRIAAIGPATARVLEDEGFPAPRIADPHTLEGLAAAVADLAESGSR